MELDRIRFGFPKGTKKEYEKLLRDIEMQITDFLENSTFSQKKKLLISLFEGVFWQGERDLTKLHPSEISYGFCSRMAYFKLLSIPLDKGFIPVVNNDLQKIFDYGTLVHFYVQYNLLKAGFIYDFETPIRVPEYKITGSADGVGEDFILEIKTINPYSFGGLKAPKPEHIKQASLYAYFLHKKDILFLYIDKSSLKIKTYKVPFDADYINSVIKDLNVLRMQKKHTYGLKNRIIKPAEINYKKLPKRECKSRIGEKAMKCPFADTCFKKD